MPVESSTLTMQILDRKIPVKPINTLTVDQMSVFYRLMRQAVRTDSFTIESREKVDRILQRLLEPDDNNWLDDQIIDGNTTWLEVLQKIFDTIVAYQQEEGGKEPAPTAEPVKRARRAQR